MFYVYNGEFRLKPFRLTIVLIIALLFGQAWAELELPAYMQDIVDTGLQNNGIESDVYHFISKDHLEQELVFAAAQQKQTILDAYTLIKPNEASEGQKEEVPALKEEPVYFLDPKISKEEREQLREAWSRIGLCALFVSQSKTPFQYSPQAVAALQEQAETVLKGQGASLLESMQAQMLKREYESLGMDMEAM